ncbi:hypothetical protein QBC39DRAFT_94396 [Podospora conica]|nr:hypothetical protein QBC39DRAFT_94396 [Schizothecium conicum]
MRLRNLVPVRWLCSGWVTTGCRAGRDDTADNTMHHLSLWQWRRGGTGPPMGARAPRLKARRSAYRVPFRVRTRRTGYQAGAAVGVRGSRVWSCIDIRLAADTRALSRTASRRAGSQTGWKIRKSDGLPPCDAKKEFGEARHADAATGPSRFSCTRDGVTASPNVPARPVPRQSLLRQVPAARGMIPFDLKL